MNKLQIKDTKIKTIIGMAVALLIWAILGYGVGIDQLYTPTGAYAQGAFTITGNTSDGEFANISVGSTTLCYYFNTTGIGKPVGCLVVDVRNNWNTTNISAANLTTAINGDADTDGVLTASASAGTVTIVSDVYGETPNSYKLSDTGVNIASSGMSGGTHTNAAPSTIKAIAQLGIAIAASLAVMIRFFE